MKKGILMLVFLSFLAFSSDKNAPVIPREDITYKPKVQYNSTPDVISGRDQAKTKTQTIFTYNENNVYRIYATPNFLTTLQLNADEKITFLAGGDTENWQIEEAQGGKKNGTFIFLKPIEEDLKTNIVITTNKRIYNLQVSSTDDEYNSLVKWNYPEDAEIVKKFNEENSETLATSAENLNMNYTVTNKNYPFAPVRIFDDGQKTYFEMKEGIQEMPTLFAKGDDNKYSQVVFRVDDKGRYVVDRTAQRFMFILGKKNSVVVNRSYLN